MKPYMLLTAGIWLAASQAATRAADRSCASDFCPQTSSAWTIFADSNPGAPDFWWKPDAVRVRRITICQHGVLVEGAEMYFDPGDGLENPTIIPNTRLVLCWGREELELRGYLDVYFGEPPTVIAAHSPDQGRLFHHGLLEMRLPPEEDTQSGKEDAQSYGPGPG
jgi:hypothetical protein